MRLVDATRYVTPLREGGSLPAIVEGDDLGTYVLKFRGAGQGRRALIAELVAGEIAREIGLPVPEIVFMDLDPALARSEPDSEIRALVLASAGLNLGIDYLPGALTYDPLVAPAVAADFASWVVWFDAYCSNVDRTVRNTNMLLWHRAIYLIDHGAALYFHHDWGDYLASSKGRFPQIRQHVLLPFASRIAEADHTLSMTLQPEALRRIVELIPDEWLRDETRFAEPAAHRAAYLEYLVSRLTPPRAFAQEAMEAHARLV
jgi:HipA-like protein